MAIIAPIISAGLGIAKSIFGASDAKKARRELDSLTPVEYNIQNEYFDNRNIAASQAATGLPEATQNFYTTETQRGLGSSLGTLTQVGGIDPNITNQLLDTHNRGIQAIAAEDANRIKDNIRYFIDQNSKLAAQKTMKWAINDYQPYQRKLKQLYQRQRVGEENMWGGIGDTISSLAAYETAKQNEDLNKEKPDEQTTDEQTTDEQRGGGTLPVKTPLPTQTPIQTQQAPFVMPNFNSLEAFELNDLGLG